MKVKKDEVHIFLGLETLQLDETEAKPTNTPSPKK